MPLPGSAHLKGRAGLGILGVNRRSQVVGRWKEDLGEETDGAGTQQQGH